MAPARAVDSRDADAARVAVWAIVGPTGSGKSDIAMEVAAHAGAEIVAVDSMTIYRGLDIGTAKPSAGDRARVPHHLIDIADPAHPFSVAQFQQAARAAIAGIAARRARPLLVGGSGLYFRAVVDDLQFPPTDAAVRAALQEQDPATLRERLRAADPDAAGSIDPANLRRVIRALEVVEITGSTFSTFRATWDRYESRYDLAVAGVAVPASELRRRISLRTRAMLDAGLVDEVRGLLERGLRGAMTASRAIAYGQVVEHLEGRLSLEQTAAAIDTATWRYARRQMTWFRKDPRIRWFEATNPATLADPLGEWLTKGGGSPRGPAVD